jgi:hypothetical protein
VRESTILISIQDEEYSGKLNAFVSLVACHYITSSYESFLK